MFHEFVEVLKNLQGCNKLIKKLTECFQTEHKRDCKPSLSCDQEIKPSQSEVSNGNTNVPVSVESSRSHTTLGQANTNVSFVCPCCKRCSLEQYLSDEGCPEADGKTLFPYLNTPNLSDEDRMILENGYDFESENMDFENLLYRGGLRVCEVPSTSSSDERDSPTVS